jgi:DNA polymerase-3 subunit epsilon
MRYFEEEYVVVDLETTGLSPFNGNEIIEIGVTEIKGDNVGNNYSRFVKPKNPIPGLITNLTNITDEMVKDAPLIEEVLPKFREYIGDKTIIAHNAKFDIGFLNYYLEKLNLPLIDKYVCTMEMLKRNKEYKGRNNKLQTACDYYGILNENAHRADSDTLATAKLFMKIRLSM